MIHRFSAWGWFYSKLNIQLPCTVHLKNADFTKNAQSTENILIWWRALHSVLLVSADQCWGLRKLLFFFWLRAQHKKHLKGQLSGSKWHVFTPSDRTSDIIRLKRVFNTQRMECFFTSVRLAVWICFCIFGQPLLSFLSKMNSYLPGTHDLRIK